MIDLLLSAASSVAWLLAVVWQGACLLCLCLWIASLFCDSSAGRWLDRNRNDGP